MIICIADVLTPEELSGCLSQLDRADFVDGRTTAGWHARLVKQNSQLRSDASHMQALRQTVQQALARNTLFQMVALPKTISPILFSRYEVGMAYGSHVDNAFMREGALMRSDLSVTLFLSDPATYSGGELVIENTQGEHPFKLAAGSMIVYPASTLHRVEPVSQGIRLAAVAWVQSLVKDPAEREILFDLDTVRQAVFAQQGKTAEFDLLCKSYANLLRKWGDV